MLQQFAWWYTGMQQFKNPTATRFWAEALPDLLLPLAHFEGFGIDAWQVVCVDQHS